MTARTNLSKTHLVREDTVDTLLVQVGEPGQTLELVLLQLGHEHLGLRDRDAVLAQRRVLEVELVAVHYERVSTWTHCTCERWDSRSIGAGAWSAPERS